MSGQIFDTAAILMVAAALFGFFNHHVLRLPFTIGLVISALLASAGTLLFDKFFPSLGIASSITHLIGSIDFYESLMHGMLSFLLFAGALHVDLDDLLSKKGPILTLATVGVLLSTALFGFGSFALFKICGYPIPLPYCLVFGALISPTDPVAVLGILRSAGVPASIETKISGESLFNDGMGIVLFSVLLTVALGASSDPHSAIEGLTILEILGREVIGGLLLGFIAGYGAYKAMHTLDEPNLEILISVALVMGITFLAFQLHTSAPLACVIAGLFIGNHGRRFAMSQKTREALDYVWSFVDHSLNAVLFLLIGLEVIAIQFHLNYALIGAVLIVVSLLARWISVSTTVLALKLRYEFSPGAIKVLTWGGLKGGISVALALSLPSHFVGREAILTATYMVVIFSIVVQGLTIGPLIRRQHLEQTER